MEPLGVVRHLVQYWYVTAIVLPALVGLWVALDEPGAAPDADDRLSVQSELESALREDSAKLAELVARCGDGTAGGSVEALRQPTLTVDAPELGSMPWVGPRRARGTARIALEKNGHTCRYEVGFEYAWQSTGSVKTTVHGPHVSAHGVTGRRAIISALQFTPR